MRKHKCKEHGIKVLCLFQVFLVRKVTPPDDNQLYAMKVLKKATLKGLSPSQNTQIYFTKF